MGVENLKQIFSVKLNDIVCNRFKTRKDFTDAYFKKYNTDIYDTSKGWFTARSIPREETLLQLSELLDCDVDYFYGRQGNYYRKEIKEIQSYTGFSQQSSEILLKLSGTEKEALDIMISTYSIVKIIKSMIKIASFINHNGEISIILENNMWHRYMPEHESIPKDIKYLEDKLNSYDTRKMFESQMQQEITEMTNIILNNENWQMKAKNEFISALLKRHNISSEDLKSRTHVKEKPKLPDFTKDGD